MSPIFRCLRFGISQVYRPVGSRSGLWISTGTTTNPPKPLDTACTIKEEPNSVQRRVPPYWNRTWNPSHHLAAGWGNEQMHPNQKCAHLLRSYPAHGYTGCGKIRFSDRPGLVARGFSLGSPRHYGRRINAGFSPWDTLLAPSSQDSPFSAAYISDISNRTNFVSRFESKSLLKNILESNAGGGRGYPPKHRRSHICNPARGHLDNCPFWTQGRGAVSRDIDRNGGNHRK
jgi:hypothetical protein